MTKIKAFLIDESGASMAEYAILLAIVSVAAFTAIKGLGTAINNKVDDAAAKITAG